MLQFQTLLCYKFQEQKKIEDLEGGEYVELWLQKIWYAQCVQHEISLQCGKDLYTKESQMQKSECIKRRGHQWPNITDAFIEQF